MPLATHIHITLVPLIFNGGKDKRGVRMKKILFKTVRYKIKTNIFKFYK